MKPLIVFSIIFLLGAVTVAGWLGFRSTDAEAAETPAPPYSAASTAAATPPATRGAAWAWPW